MHHTIPYQRCLRHSKITSFAIAPVMARKASTQFYVVLATDATQYLPDLRGVPTALSGKGWKRQEEDMGSGRV